VSILINCGNAAEIFLHLLGRYAGSSTSEFRGVPADLAAEAATSDGDGMAPGCEHRRNCSTAFSCSAAPCSGHCCCSRLCSCNMHCAAK